MDSLPINKEVYSLLRYGKQGVKDENKIVKQSIISTGTSQNNDFYAVEEVVFLL